MLSFNVSECKQSGPYELLSTVRLTAAGKRITLERAKAHMAITAARYTRQETLPDFLTRLQRLPLSPQVPHRGTPSTEPLYGGLLYGGSSVL